MCDAPHIGAAQLVTSTEITPPQPSLCINKKPIQYDFRGSVKPIRYGVNTASDFLIQIQINVNLKD